MFDYHGVKYMCDLHFVYGPLHDNVYDIKSLEQWNRILKWLIWYCIIRRKKYSISVI